MLLKQLTQITSFEFLLSSTADSYVDYHRYHPACCKLHNHILARVIICYYSYTKSKTLSNNCKMIFRLHPMKLNLHGEVKMTDTERNEFSQEIAIFITAFAAEVRDLKKTIGTNPKTSSSNGKTPSGDTSKEGISHKEDISTFLLEVRHCHYSLHLVIFNFPIHVH